ncbi:MAG: DNA repair exonuclease [Fimbriimonadaceae bacterium]|nr:DNA repair exonuclease [Fimbriimonadaceae bacterium]
MPRFIHTADLQIGKMFESLAAPSDRLAFLRKARIDVIRRVGKLARERSASAVLVAGDVFERSELRELVLREALAAMSETELVWVLLPGNHDPDGASSIWERITRIGCPANVILAREQQPILLADGALAIVPAPLTRRHQYADPTSHFDACPTPAGAVRVGLAHGSLQNRLAPSAETHNMILDTRAEQAQLDYLALGDWHSMREIAPRTWYAGTPEADGFDQTSGYVLVVDIAGPKQPPTVEPVRVGEYKWQRIEAVLHSPDSEVGLRTALAGIEEPWAKSVVDLRLSGAVSLAERTRIDECLADLEARLQVLRLDTSNLRSLPSETDLDELGRHGYIADVVQRLRSLSSSAGDPDSAFAEAALHRLYVEHSIGGK